jgi:hypothetical protein
MPGCACCPFANLLLDAGFGTLLLRGGDDAPPDADIFILLAARSDSLDPAVPFCVYPYLGAAIPLRAMLAVLDGLLELVGGTIPFVVRWFTKAFVRGSPEVWYALSGSGGYGDICACEGRDAVGKGMFCLMAGAFATDNEDSGPSSLSSGSSSFVRSTTECRQSLRMLDCLLML